MSNGLIGKENMAKKTGILSGANLEFFWRRYASKTLVRYVTENAMHFLFSKQENTSFSLS